MAEKKNVMADKEKEKKKLELNINASDLRTTHELYDKYIDEWRFLNAAYEGIRALIGYGAMYKHERESSGNYTRRLAQAYGFTYSGSIVDLLNSYLFKKEYPKTIPDAIVNNEEWKMFQKDCDLEETPFDEFFIDQGRDASIQGHVGLLVDRPSTEKETVAEEKDAGIYPYVVAYKPPAILDWRYERDQTGRKKLIYIKFYDDDGYYRIWSPDEWQVWEIEDEGEETQLPKVSVGADNSRLGEGQVGHIEPAVENAKLIRFGENPLGEIPFTVLYNKRSTIDRIIGASDISDVSRIDASIMRNLSQIEEVIDYAAFPMMRKPMREAGIDGAVPAREDEVGATAVLEFDPEHPESKPDWLEAAVEGPINAILRAIEKKVSETYRSTNVGGMASMEISKQAKSGTALKAEFQLLNSKLVKKAKNIVRSKKNVVKYWLMWQDIYEQYKDEIVFDPIKTFEVEDLATDLENLLTSTIIVTLSPTYNRETQKQAARLILPTDKEDVVNQVEKEIDEAVVLAPGEIPSEEPGAIPPEGVLKQVA